IRKERQPQYESGCSDAHGRKLHAPTRAGRSLVRLHRDVDAALLLSRELDVAFAQSEQRVVLAHANAVAGVPFGAALPDDDVAGEHALAARLFDSKPASGRVAAVARGAACFLMCHG